MAAKYRVRRALQEADQERFKFGQNDVRPIDLYRSPLYIVNLIWGNK